MSFTFGPEWARDTGCCAKPIGCTYTGPACLMRGHPWKRRHVLTTPTSLFEVGATDVADTSDDYYTPRWIFDAAGLVFDLDVAAPADPARRICPARRYLTPVEDGLSQSWDGLVWMNPPYSNMTSWVDRFAAHRSGLALIPALRRTRSVGLLLESADAITLLTVIFGRPDGRTTEFPNTLLLAACGDEGVEGLARVAAADKYMRGAYHVRPDNRR